MKNKTIKIYDSTLRDGAQTKGVSFSIDDKLRILEILTDIGVDYVEAGWPGANPTDDKLFKTLPKKFRSKVVAFGMMRKKGQSANNDPGLNAVLNSGVPTTCLVGKSWDFHVKSALRVTNSENLDMIYDSINYACKIAKGDMLCLLHAGDIYYDNNVIQRFSVYF